ncbi:hypothetical protein ACJIZ3_011381 [Penstemon smallii]|uniref:Uncharacterized protein n=1 Tax=Penstemon smallii TaxID=265156 RepID=A0ABD3UJ04_9LAMI
MNQIIKVIYSYPRFLIHKPEIIRKCVVKADEMGVNRSSRMFICAVRVGSSMNEESWELKLQTFRDMGFSEYDILRVFRNSPIVFGVSKKKLRKVEEVLLANGKIDMSCIIKNPVSLRYSVEKRLKLRFRVLEILESKNLITNWPSFATLINMSSKRFFKKFVSPYLEEVGDVYKAKSELACFTCIFLTVCFDHFNVCVVASHECLRSCSSNTSNKKIPLRVALH